MSNDKISFEFIWRLVGIIVFFVFVAMAHFYTLSLFNFESIFLRALCGFFELIIVLFVTIYGLAFFFNIKIESPISYLKRKMRKKENEHQNI